MKTEQIVILVVAFFLGMLLLNVVKNVCGCGVKEGFSTANASLAVAKLSEQCTDWWSKVGVSGDQFKDSLGGSCGNDPDVAFGQSPSPLIYEGEFQEEAVQRIATLDQFCAGELGARALLNACEPCRGWSEPDTGVNILNRGCVPPEEPTCTGYTPTPGYTITNDVLDMNSCASGYVGNPAVSCGTGGGNYTLSGCETGCATAENRTCTNPLETWDDSNTCTGQNCPGQCCAFDSTKWVADADPPSDQESANMSTVYTFDNTGGSALTGSCPQRDSPIPGCNYPFVYSNIDTNDQCTLLTPDDLQSRTTLKELMSTDKNFRLCRPRDNTGVFRNTELTCTRLR